MRREGSVATVTSTVADRAARAIVHRLLRRLDGGELELVERGRVHRFGTPAPADGRPPLRARIEVRDGAFYRALLRGSTGAGAAYADGAWECDDLVAVVRIAARAMGAADRVRERLLPLTAPVQRTAWRARANTRARARARISAHYDLGNELFASFLDPTLSYSCLVFERPEASLHEAAVAKLERVCRKLALGPGDRVLEIGTGWGGFALHAAARYGCHVTTTTISREQHAHVVRAVADAGLQDRVTVLLEDYRDLRGTYDKLVSIEMIEAVGWEHLDTFFAVCSRRLAPHGTMLLQAIVYDDRAYRIAKGAPSFANTLVFPGGALPSLGAIERSLGRVGDLRTVQLEDISGHYVRTLHAWRERFLAAWPRLRGRGYDERFRRLWTLYLAYCEAGFAERRIRDVQLLLAKPAFADEPLAPLPAVGGAPAQRAGDGAAAVPGGAATTGGAAAAPDRSAATPDAAA